MGKLLLRTRVAIEDCETHLNDSGAFGTEIESYLTQHVLVILCADMQSEIYRIADERAKRADDGGLVNYVTSTSKRILRSVRKDEIASYVGMFGTAAKQMLNDLVDDSDVTIYNNAVKNRHHVAHNQGAQITFRELKDTTDVAERLLLAVTTSLESVPDKETS